MELDIDYSFEEHILNHQLSIILIEPENSINIGAVLRAASNFGFYDLRIVNPQSFDLDKIKTSACWGSFLIEKIKHFTSIEDAIADLNLVLGFSSSHGAKRPPHITLPKLITEFNPNLKTGLLFGPEDSGLTLEHMSYCKYLVRIPTSTKNPSINLAQSVLLVLYEFSKLTWDKSELKAEFPVQSDFQQLKKMLQELGTISGFIGTGTPKPIPEQLNNLFLRLSPNQQEMGVLLAYFGKLHRYLKRNI